MAAQGLCGFGLVAAMNVTKPDRDATGGSQFWPTGTLQLSAMHVRLVRKFANCLDGIDISHVEVGDVIELPASDAILLIAEGWAVPQTRRGSGQEIRAHSEETRAHPELQPRDVAADEPNRTQRTLEQLRHVREQMEQRVFEYREHRRIEDEIREELRDARAKTIPKL
jgi:hypothetical protein